MTPPETSEAPTEEPAHSAPDNNGFLDSLTQAMGDPTEKFHPGPANSDPVPSRAAEPEPEPPDNAPVPDAPPADAPAGEEPSKYKKGTYKYLKEQFERQNEKLKGDYDVRLKELEQKAGGYESTSKEYQAKLDAAEALKNKHEQTVKELEENIVGQWETPYSVDVDPEAGPVLRRLESAREKLNFALSSAVSGMHDDPGKVELMYNQHAALFGSVMSAMAQNPRYPVSAHAQHLISELAKNGINVEYSAAMDAVKTLQRHVPDLQDVGNTQQVLDDIKSKNEPNWQKDQSARAEAYRRSLTGLADVPEDAEGGDDEVFARVLKSDPELKAMLKTESDRVSAEITGPMPGRADARAVREAPRKLHQNAMRAARLPVAMEALRRAAKTETDLRTRITDLETRINDDGASVPRGTTTPPAPSSTSGDSRPLRQRLDEIMNL